jgi:hypothetical protein
MTVAFLRRACGSETEVENSPTQNRKGIGLLPSAQKWKSTRFLCPRMSRRTPVNTEEIFVTKV